MTKILRSVEASDSSWWGYAHAEPASDSRHPPVDQLRPTHVALSGDVPAELLAQQVAVASGRCPCAAEAKICVPVTADWPAGTVLRHGSLKEMARAYADAG